MKLTSVELMNVEGGAIKILTGVLVGLGGLIALLSGIIDGYLNPLKCRK